MRIALLACVLGFAVSAPAQTTAPQFASLLAALHAENWQDRAGAFEQLRSAAKATSNKTVRAALMELQDRENHLTEATAPDQDHAEAFAEYLASLGHVLFEVGDWNDAHDLCIFAHAAYNTDSRWAARLAASGKKVVPCLVQMAMSDKASFRFRSIPMLIQIRANERNLDSETAQEIRDIATGALHDPDEGVRAFTVNALSKFGERDMIPALEDVAKTDPAPAVQGNSVRRDAAEAITAIQRRSK